MHLHYVKFIITREVLFQWLSYTQFSYKCLMPVYVGWYHTCNPSLFIRKPRDIRIKLNWCQYFSPWKIYREISPKSCFYLFYFFLAYDWAEWLGVLLNKFVWRTSWHKILYFFITDFDLKEYLGMRKTIFTI